MFLIKNLKEKKGKKKRGGNNTSEKWGRGLGRHRKALTGVVVINVISTRRLKGSRLLMYCPLILLEAGFAPNTVESGC